MAIDLPAGNLPVASHSSASLQNITVTRSGFLPSPKWTYFQGLANLFINFPFCDILKDIQTGCPKLHRFNIAQAKLLPVVPPQPQPVKGISGLT